MKDTSLTNKTAFAAVALWCALNGEYSSFIYFKESQRVKIS